MNCLDKFKYTVLMILENLHESHKQFYMRQHVQSNVYLGYALYIAQNDRSKFDYQHEYYYVERLNSIYQLILDKIERPSIKLINEVLKDYQEVIDALRLYLNEEQIANDRLSIIDKETKKLDYLNHKKSRLKKAFTGLVYSASASICLTRNYRKLTSLSISRVTTDRHLLNILHFYNIYTLGQLAFYLRKLLLMSDNITWPNGVHCSYGLSKHSYYKCLDILKENGLKPV